MSLLQVRRALTTSLYCFYCLQISNAEFIKFTPSFLLLFYGVKFSDSDVRDSRKFNSCFIFFARLAASASKIVKRPLCRCSFVKFNPLAKFSTDKREKIYKTATDLLFLDCDLGLIVFELKFTGRDPNGRAILALVFCGSDLAAGAVWGRSVFAAISVCEALFLKMS